MRTLFVSGIGTGIGKTLVAAILTEALGADYWKPVQAGYSAGTDSEWVRKQISNPSSHIHAETYKFQQAASPHIAARAEGRRILLEKILEEHKGIISRELTIPGPEILKQNKANASAGQRGGLNDWLVVEGAGGLMVPLNENEFVIDLAKMMDAKLILVSRNYLGSINHSLLSARACKASGIQVLGWIFNDQYLDYESEIVQWTEYKRIASIPFQKDPDALFVRQQAKKIREILIECLD